MLIVFMSVKTAMSQISYETSKAVLIYQFAQKIGHPNEKTLKSYKISFLGNDLETFHELKKIVATNTIKDKKVELSFIKNINEIEDIQLLYIDKSYGEQISSVWKKIQNKQILLVSEQSLDSKYIMLNIFYNEINSNVSFQINKANIIIENLTINPELLLIGGEEVDIRELYHDMRRQLEKKKDEIENQKITIANKSAEIQNLRLYADSLYFDITILLDKISLSEGNLRYLVDSIKVQREILSLKLSQINEQEIKLLSQKAQILEKEIEIEDRTNQLKKILSESNKQKVKIIQQEGNLSDKENIIETKTRQLYLTSITVLLFIFLALIVIYALISKHKTNKKLQAKKEALEETLKKLNDTKDKLIQSEKMASLGVLTAGIAHEINNPVNYISSGVEGLSTITKQLNIIISQYQDITDEKSFNKFKLLNTKKTKDEFDFLILGIEKLTKNIKTGVKRTGDIVKSLKTFSSPDEGSLTLGNIHEIIGLSITLLKNEHKNRIKIIENYSDIPDIYCYPGKLNQVFINLLSNAIQSIKNDGTITITTSIIYDHELCNNEKSCIRISIKDTGDGIDKNLITKIFQPFFTTKEVGKGTGLGLSITHGIIEQHNGKIFVKNNTDSGAEFIIFIPIKTTN